MRFILLLPLLWLAGCTPAGENDTGNAVTPAEPSAANSAQSAVPAPTAGEEQANATQTAGSDSAAPPGAFQWTGRYAASRALCSGGAWEFTNARVETQGETSCAIRDASEAGGKVELRLSCTAEGMKSDETWTLASTANNGMSVRRSTPTEKIDVELIRCG